MQAEDRQLLKEPSAFLLRFVSQQEPVDIVKWR
jgi:hypothetical protein